jgi:hypothetical protein
MNLFLEFYDFKKNRLTDDEENVAKEFEKVSDKELYKQLSDFVENNFEEEFYKAVADLDSGTNLNMFDLLRYANLNCFDFLKDRLDKPINDVET